MSSIGTFGSFTTARLGIYAAQKGLSVTGNNISNINTPGYTRQRLDQVSMRTGSGDRYQSKYNVRVGNGALCVGVSQIRDPYLDIRYREELAKVGASDTKLSGLNELASILDEVFDGDSEKNGVIEAQFMELMKTLQNLATNTGDKGNDSQVKSAATVLAGLLNSYSNDLDGITENTIKKLEQDVESVNKILTNIRELNNAIRKSEIHGDSALEMRDERNRLIDELSRYMKIDVTYSMEDVGAGRQVEKLTIKLGNANPDTGVTTDSTTLVDGTYAAQIGFTQVAKPNPNYDPNQPQGGNNLPFLDINGNPVQDENNAARVDSPNFDLTVSELRNAEDEVLQGSVSVDLDDNDLYGSIQSYRELLTESGEFSTQDYINNVDEKAATKRGIPYYKKSLDLLANKFAEVFNQANQGFVPNEKGEFVRDDGTVVNVAVGGVNLDKNTFDPNNPAHVQALKNANVEERGGPLFSNSGDGNDTDGITAGNISVSADWAKENIHIVSSFVRPSSGDTGTTDNSNINHMISLMGTKLDFMPGAVVNGNVGNTALFHGTFQEMLGNISSTLGNDQKATNTLLNTCYSSAVELDTSRDSVSGVDLNDEAANMMQYQKSYSAACRLMTTLDEALDKLINGTGIVGR